MLCQPLLKNFLGVEQMSVLSQRLKSARRLTDSTQKQVADGISVAESAYQRYERGTVKPSYDIIIKLCQYFNVSSDYLLGLSDDPTRH